jgi:transcriptional regulator with XRE-family HTH domain
MTEARADATEPVEVKRRRVRGELRQARTNADLTQKAAAEGLFWSASKIVRIEQGTVPVTPTDVRAMLHLYGVKDEARIEALVELAQQAREEKGWSTFSDILSQASLELFGNEPAAKVIYEYEPSVVPGLLQTPEYTRSLLKALGNSEAEIKRRLAARAQRQVLLDKPVHPDLIFIVGETALSRPVGGEDTMREQIGHILQLSNTKGITILLMPFSAGAHRGMGSSFTVVQFEDPLLPDLLYLENAEQESVSRDEEKDVRSHLELFAELQDKATKSGPLEDHIKRILRERFDEGHTSEQ